MNSKKILLTLLLVLLVLSIPSGYFIYDSLFPKADPITCPEVEEVMSISITLENNETHTLDETEIEELLQSISNSEPTRHLALNERPGVETYHTIVIQTSEREIYYFIYEEDSKVYIFAPYEGVYESNQQVLLYSWRKSIV